MAGAWRHRVVKDEKGRLHFAALRFRPLENTPSGIVSIFNDGANIEDMRQLTLELLAACDERIIDADHLTDDEQNDGEDVE